MSKPFGSGKIEQTPAAIQRALEAARKEDARQDRREEQDKLQRQRARQRKQNIKYKFSHLDYLKQQSERRAQEREEAEKKKRAEVGQVQPARLSASDTTGQNYANLASNLGGSAIQIGSLAWRAHKEREEKRKKEAQSGGEAGTTAPQGISSTPTSEVTPPTGPKGKKNKKQPKPPIVKFFKQLRKRARRGFSSIKPGGGTESKDASGISSTPTSEVTPPTGSKGKKNKKKNRRNISSKTPEGEMGGTTSPQGPIRNPFRTGKGNRSLGGSDIEEQYYSCWREEFLYELSTLRQKTREKKRIKDEKPVDIMRGRNNVKLNPNVTEKYEYSYLQESMNGASIFAKATPPLKRRTTPMSDIHLSKQPGKRSLEQLNKENRRLFLGYRGNYFPNYDLSGHFSDGSDVDSNKSIKSEAYDENDETFRQHSRERFTADSSDSEIRKRRANVLKALAAMNQDVKKTKKSKKKKKEK